MAAVARKKALIPLSPFHVIEISKRNDAVSREYLARTQAKFSKGHVIRSRKGRFIAGDIFSVLPILFLSFFSLLLV